MNKVYPKKLKNGSHIRVIAPSLSMSIISEETKHYAIECLNELGFKVSFGKHVNETNIFNSSSIKSRLEDLHEAFADKSVDGILTAIGGYNCNQLLDYIDWSLIRKNPKVFCGYSDITILSNAILSQTNLITYYGPHFSTFGQKILDQYTVDYFLKALVNDNSFNINPSINWSDDQWYLDQDNREIRKNEGLWIIQKGKASGNIIGGHLGTFCLMQGTKYLPSLSKSILIIEEDAEPANPKEFDRRLQSVLQQTDSELIQGVLIGRFEKVYGMTQELLKEIISSKKELSGKPVIANVDFGHTEPHCTLPIGGNIEINVENNHAYIIVAQKD